MYAAGRIPGSFFRREGRPTERRDPDLPADRPAAAAVLRRRPAQRGAGRGHGDEPEPGRHVRRGGDQRCVRVHPARRAAVLRADRRGAGGTDQRRGRHQPVGGVPDLPAARARRVRHGRRGPAGRRRLRRRRRCRDHDGRGRGDRVRHRVGRRRRAGSDRGGRRGRARGGQAVHPRAGRRPAAVGRRGGEADRRLPALPGLPAGRAGGRDRSRPRRRRRGADDPGQAAARGPARRDQGGRAATGSASGSRAGRASSAARSAR